MLQVDIIDHNALSLHACQQNQKAALNMAKIPHEYQNIIQISTLNRWGRLLTLSFAIYISMTKLLMKAWTIFSGLISLRLGQLCLLLIDTNSEYLSWPI